MPRTLRVPRPLSGGGAVARLAAVLLVGAGLAGCAGMRTPSFLHLGGGNKAPKSKLKGERIPVLGLNDRLEPNAALKGIGFDVPAAQPQPDWPQPGGRPSTRSTAWSPRPS